MKSIRLILAAFLFCSTIQVNSIDLLQPVLSIIIRYDRTFVISPENFLSQLEMLNKNQCYFQQNIMTQISNEIAVLADLEAPYKYNTWTFQISQNYATLDYITINIDIKRNKQAHITGGIVRLTQYIPQQYDDVQYCAQTGGTYESHKIECNWYCVPRELDQDEINYVIAHLTNYLMTTQKLIT